MATIRPSISSAGMPIVILFLVASLTVHVVFHLGWAIPLWCLTFLIAYLFRDPGRAIPSDPLAILCPVDGEVTAVEKIKDPCLNREAIQITVMKKWLDAYVIRSPTEGTPKHVIEGNCMKMGESLGEAHEKVNCIWIQTDEFDDVVMIIRSDWFKYFKCVLMLGEKVGQGQRCGNVPLSAKIDVIVPDTSRVKVEVGQTVLAGTSILASLIRKK